MDRRVGIPPGSPGGVLAGRCGQPWQFSAASPPIDLGLASGQDLLNRLLPAIAIALLALSLLTGPLLADELEEQTWAIAGKLACPVCAGQSVKDSGAELAVQMRSIIATQLAQGRSEPQIIEYLVDRYGAEILLDPPKSGIQLWVWIGPVAILAIGVLMVLARFDYSALLARWRRDR